MPFVVLFTVPGRIWRVWLVGYAMPFVKQKGSEPKRREGGVILRIPFQAELVAQKICWGNVTQRAWTPGLIKAERG
jgi:hypothetical protein